MVICQPHISYNLLSLRKPQPLLTSPNHRRPEYRKISPKQKGTPPSSWLPVLRTDIYLESWHRVCLHIEARVATLIQCPIIGFLETGHIEIC